MERLLVRARQVEEWGTPPILHACLTVVAADPDHAGALATFLQTAVPPARVTPAVVPLLSDKPWAKGLMSHWASNGDTPQNVKRAITKDAKGGR